MISSVYPGRLNGSGKCQILILNIDLGSAFKPEVLKSFDETDAQLAQNACEPDLLQSRNASGQDNTKWLVLAVLTLVN